MKTALLVTTILVFGVVSANAGNHQRHASSLNKRQHIESAVMAVGVPEGGSIDQRPAWSLYQQNLRDSGYDAKSNFNKAGQMCSSCDYHGN